MSYFQNAAKARLRLVQEADLELQVNRYRQEEILAVAEQCGAVIVGDRVQSSPPDDVMAEASKVDGLERDLSEIECDKTTAGTYTLSCTVDSSGNKTYSWA